MEGLGSGPVTKRASADSTPAWSPSCAHMTMVKRARASTAQALLLSVAILCPNLRPYGGDGARRAFDGAGTID
jgi:hypothetical protein